MVFGCGICAKVADDVCRDPTPEGQIRVPGELSTIEVRGLRIAVIGAAGRTGKELVTQALGHGHHVSALVRPSHPFGSEHERLTTVEGDVRDAVSVKAVVSECDCVFSALGSGGETPVRVFSEGADVIIAAMRDCGVFRLVCVSSAGVGAPDRVGGVVGRVLSPARARMARVAEDLRRMERRVMESDTYWTIVRPTALTDGPLTGVYRVVEGPRVPKGNKISRADLAAFMLKAAGQGSYVRAAVAIAY